MYLQLPNNISLSDLYLEEEQTIWFLIWILKKAMPCDQYISQMILEFPFQVIQKTYEDGNPRQYIQKNWKIHGLDREWYSNGQLWYERNWKNGNLHGRKRGWYFNGSLMYKCYWKNSNPCGPARGWHENGQLKYEQNWKNGKKDGLERWWYKNGQLGHEENWENGVKIE